MSDISIAKTDRTLFTTCSLWYDPAAPQRPGEVGGGAAEELVSQPRPGDGAGCGAEEQRAEDAGRDADRAQK